MSTTAGQPTSSFRLKERGDVVIIRLGNGAANVDIAEVIPKLTNRLEKLNSDV